MRKTSTPASHKRRIRCGSREAGPRVATIFTRRRRRMLSPSPSWLSHQNALVVHQGGKRLGGAGGVSCSYDEYATHTRVCTDALRKLATTLPETRSALHIRSALSN